MKDEKVKTKPNSDAHLLELLKDVLPRATHDPKLANQIYQAVEGQLKLKARANAFDKFCKKVELPNLDAPALEELKRQLKASFGDGDITIKPNRKEQSLAIEVALPDGAQFQSEIKVRPNGPVVSEEEIVTLKFVPFPVSLPGDKELVWFLAKRENMTNEEAAIALSKVEDNFWGSKTGQKLIRDRVERCFPEFISRAPAGLLNEVGLKRHYKDPEPVKVMNPQVLTK